MSHIERTPPLSEVIQRAVSAFEKAFGSRPRWGAQAPGRVNLIGEHTDYNEGFVLPIAIDRACVCVGGPGRGRRLRIVAVDLDERIEMQAESGLMPGASFQNQRGEEARWAAYVAGVAAEFRDERGSARRLGALDLAVSSSVPLGGGLSSSASLEVAVATMLEGASDVRLEPLEKARLCQRAEHRWARVPCGIMDQYAAVFGRAGHALLVDCRSTTHELIAMPPEDEAVALVANTNVHHELAAGEYAKRRAACESAARSLGLSSLRDAPPRNPREGAWMAPEEQRCIAHVHVENMLVRLVADDLKLGARGKGLPGISQEDWRPHLREIGRAMCESHRSLRDIYRVSCPELDTLVEVACSVEAVYGARMTGGGFGGCVIALVRPEAAEQLAAAWKAAYRERHGRECTIFRVKAADGAGPVELGRHGSGT